MSTPRRAPFSVPKPGYTEAGATLHAEATERHQMATAPENTVQYGQEALTLRPMFRPSARMPMEAHVEARRFLIAAEHRTQFHQGICRHISAVRGRLYAWAWHEHPNAESTLQGQVEIPDGALELETLTRGERDALTAGIASVKKLLSQHYPDCP